MDWKEKVLADWNGSLVLKENRAIFKGIKDTNVVIPSSMYPLKDKTYKIFCNENTANFESGSELEAKVIAAFDRVDSKVGECYKNAEMLLAELEQEGVKAESYVGWMFVGKNELPVFHCFVVVEDKVLDFAALYNSEDFEWLNKQTVQTPDESRQKITECFQSKLDLPNHERSGFGQVDKTYTYVASKCSPAEGLELHKQLLQTYPDHITYIKTHNLSKWTKSQQMIKKLGDY